MLWNIARKRLPEKLHQREQHWVVLSRKTKPLNLKKKNEKKEDIKKESKKRKNLMLVVGRGSEMVVFKQCTVGKKEKRISED